MKGIYTALVTPFKKDRSIDWGAFEKLIRQQIDSSVDGVVICGTTGESPTLSREEKIELFKRAKVLLDTTSVDLVAGTGSNSTSETLEFTRDVEGLGIRRFLIVTPYYNKPTQAGLLKHFQTVADGIRGEIILYNVPGRTSVGLLATTVAELAAHPRIVALKEATGNLTFASDIIRELRNTGRKMDLLSGDDATFLPFLALGGVGTISVASHLLGRPMKEMMAAFSKGDVQRAQEIHHRCYPLFQDLFIETNPAPVKFCLAEGKLLEPFLRLPLVEMSTEHQNLLRGHLKNWKWTQGALTE